MSVELKYLLALQALNEPLSGSYFLITFSHYVVAIGAAVCRSDQSRVHHKHVRRGFLIFYDLIIVLRIQMSPSIVNLRTNGFAR